MQTVETLNEGLKRAYTITIAAKDIDAKVDQELKTMAPRIRMPGFRPGKVPANLVRKMHGPALHQDALNSAVQEGVQKLLDEKKLRPATQPQVELKEGGEVGQDAVVDVALETLPDLPAPNIDDLKLERLTVEPEEAKVEEQLNQLVQGQKSYDPAPEGHKAETGDLVVMDFAGKVDGVAFEGGTGEGMSVEIGSGRLIPGFEDGLVGVGVGEERQLNVTFPDDYGVDTLKGKAATFDVKVTDLQRPRETQADDAFAQAMGLESIDQLRGLIKGQLEQELNGLTRTHMKRKLLDTLADRHDFPVPPSMVEAEFNQIWQQLEHEASHEADPEAARAEMEKERGDYQKIAERRVRLGLLLSEIGQQNGVAVSSQEMNQLIAQAAQQYRPQDRERFMQYVQQEPMAAAQLRAPLFEDKVVDFLFGKAEITDRAVTREQLEAEIEADVDGHVHGPGCGHDHDHDHGHDHGHDHAQEAAPAKPKAKKAKKAAPEAEAAPAVEADATTQSPEDEAAAKQAYREARAKKDAELAARKAEKEAARAAAKAAESEAAPAEAAPAEKPKKAKKAKAAE